jgi:hypothetical protein
MQALHLFAIKSGVCHAYRGKFTVLRPFGITWHKCSHVAPASEVQAKSPNGKLGWQTGKCVSFFYNNPEGNVQKKT